MSKKKLRTFSTRDFVKGVQEGKITVYEVMADNDEITAYDGDGNIVCTFGNFRHEDLIIELLDMLGVEANPV